LDDLRQKVCSRNKYLHSLQNYRKILEVEAMKWKACS
jgi:hypothetical protein